MIGELNLFLCIVGSIRRLESQFPSKFFTAELYTVTVLLESLLVYHFQDCYHISVLFMPQEFDYSVSEITMKFWVFQKVPVEMRLKRLFMSLSYNIGSLVSAAKSASWVLTESAVDGDDLDKLAKKHHPDANNNSLSAKRKFQEIRDAYEVCSCFGVACGIQLVCVMPSSFLFTFDVSEILHDNNNFVPHSVVEGTLQDSNKRAQYDRANKRHRSSEDAGYAAGDAEGFRYAYRTNFSDSFQKIFSEIFEDETLDVASDIQVQLSLSFSEAAKGCTKHLSFDASVPCDSCHGLGHPVDAKTRICPTCEGVGSVTIPPFSARCSTCKGSGKIIKEYCKECRGSGVVEGVKEVKVTIPAGVDSGDTIRVPKAGNAGGRIQPGNLLIKLKALLPFSLVFLVFGLLLKLCVAEDPIFARDGADIYVDSNISFTKAILGGNVEVPTMSGKTQVKIPKGVQPGHLIALRGKGLPKKGIFVDHGDQYVRFCIKFPTALNERQRAILEEFAKEEMEHESIMSTEGN
ncbi:LOW QUALITY PROTEIN: hypothetical protein RJ639_039648, partial [Escallonia herrerae]